VQDYSTRRRVFKKKIKNSLPSAANVALGKEAVRVDGGFFLPSADVALPSARYVALSTETFADGFFAECSLLSAALGKEPVCSSVS
jgi:hypothetical protein